MRPRNAESERQALAVLDAYMETFNAHDWPANAATLNYPPVRIAGPRVTLWPDAQAYADQNARRIETTFEHGWHHSGWDEREIVDGSDNKVHVLVRFTRYDERGTALASYPSLYIVTQVDGHWGVQARSSFAP